LQRQPLASEIDDMSDSPRTARRFLVTRSCTLLICFSLTLMSGCSGCGRHVKTTAKEQKTSNPLDQARDLYPRRQRGRQVPRRQ